MAIGDQFGAPRDLAAFRTAAVQLVDRFDTAFRAGHAIGQAYQGATAADFVAMGATAAQAAEYAQFVARLVALPANASFAALQNELDLYRNILA